MIHAIAKSLKYAKDISPQEKLLEQTVGEISCRIEDAPATLHPLGFVHFDITKIAELDDDSFVRFHIWDPRLAPLDAGGSIHDHAWHLESLILRGSLRNRNFRPEPRRGGAFAATRVTYGEKNSFDSKGHYDLKLVADQTLSAFETYSIPSRLVHESTLLSPRAVTLVVGTPDEMADICGPLIFSKDGIPRPGTECRRQLTNEQSLSILANL